MSRKRWRDKRGATAARLGRRSARRTALTTAPLLTLALLLGPGATAQVESREAERAPLGAPNILIIVTDDQRVGTFSAMPKTRKLLKNQGVHFKEAVVTTPMCCPSRASIFSGKYSHNHGVDSMDNPENLDQSETIQYELKQAGYRTGIVGKYLNNHVGNPPFFDKWAISDPHKNYLDVVFNVNGVDVFDTDYITTYETEKAVHFLSQFERSGASPWMLYVAPYAPHEPALPHWKYRSMKVPRFKNNPATQERNLKDKPLYVRRAVDDISKSKVKRFRGKQLRALRSVDDMVGKLLEKLDKFKTRNTLVFFTSDNGYQWYEHRLDKKFYPYEFSLRVPMLMRWPGQVSRSVDTRLVANIDIAPTVYDAVGISPSYTVDGRSLLTDFDRDRILVELSSYQAVPSWYGFWGKDWQYLEYPDDGFKEYYAPDDRWQLSNLYGNARTGDEPLNGPALSADLAQARLCAGSSCP